MGRTQYYVASSIDGFLADDDGGLAWLLQFEGFEGQAERYQEFLSGVGAVIMGADTYRFLLEEQPEDWAYPGLPTWVFSHRELAGYPGEDIRFVQGSPEEVHAQAVREAGERNVWMVGGGKLAAQFQQAGLLDELLLTIVPVLLGSGRRLLPDSPLREPLKLLSQRTFGKGVIELNYQLRR
ncbi:dihydrofolate reductase [Psychromicrobium silvestre]|uniref:Dihydrofolate reductase n=1 Tax=Psychromicrobium silvestre TaxID=1645614 RepID=A0A7Y9LR94_9MICC|nr:dihydrofolate reductase family protein [Psychromicrobium silvestre]NYE94127.1 dihydrofolate reductase [Psychromicrobium silvestre]